MPRQYIITDDFYNNITHSMLEKRLNDDDKNYIQSNNLDMLETMFTRWRIIVSAFPSNLYDEYAMRPPELRNEWFQKYLDLPSKEYNDIPYSLL